MRRAAFAPAAVLAVTLAGCGGGGGGTTTPPPPPPAACTTAADCADGNTCTTEACVAGACVATYTPALGDVLLGAGIAGTTAWTYPFPPLVLTPAGGASRWTCDPAHDGTPNPSTDPPVCTVEVDAASASNVVFTPTATGGRLTAFVPLRARYLLTEVLLPGTAVPIVSSVSLALGGACVGAVAQPFKIVGVQLDLDQDGAGALTVTATPDATELSAGTAFCNQSSGAGTIENALRDQIRLDVYGQLFSTLAAEYRLAAEEQLCLLAPCPGGTVDVGGICRTGPSATSPCRGRDRSPKTQALAPAACVP